MYIRFAYKNRDYRKKQQIKSQIIFLIISKYQLFIYKLKQYKNGKNIGYYYGAAWYGRDFTLTKKPAGRVTLDLGEVVSTARVLVNGREAGLRLTPPWRFDVTGLLQEGANRIEIRVCNTTANIFLSSPTVYRGGTKAGILGPVRIEIAE